MKTAFIILNMYVCTFIEKRVSVWFVLVLPYDILLLFRVLIYMYTAGQ